MATASKLEKPQLACEIAPGRVIAARLGKQATLESASTRRIPPEAVSAGLNAPNIHQGDALRNAISGALGAVGGGARARDVVAVLPDAAVRVLLVDFDSLPDKHEDAAAVVRFRVRKSLPFDVDQARLSFDAHRNGGSVKVIAALSPSSVIHEFEQAFLDAGYQPGVIMPSTLATLGLIEADRPAMLVKADPSTVSVAIVDRGELLLFRTIDHPFGEVAPRELMDYVHPSMVFFEDTFNSKIDSIYLAGLLDVSGLAAELQRETGVRCEELDSGAWRDSLGEGASRTAVAGVAGALLG